MIRLVFSGFVHWAKFSWTSWLLTRKVQVFSSLFWKISYLFEKQCEKMIRKYLRSVWFGRGVRMNYRTGLGGEEFKSATATSSKRALINFLDLPLFKPLRREDFISFKKFKNVVGCCLATLMVWWETTLWLPPIPFTVL